ncbi:hypothetical protein V1512DRAFT_212553 [Lipomyces arxii]|uniref:uncharacterized protein n=1 Tax=Lipomyces arxii TaxID=56418 RepID=UPI0034CF56F8
MVPSEQDQQPETAEDKIFDDDALKEDSDPQPVSELGDQPLFGSSPIHGTDELATFVKPLSMPTRSTSSSSDLPVEKLTSSDGSFPSARLSPMRSFSRIPAVPEPSRPMISTAYEESDEYSQSSSAPETSQQSSLAEPQLEDDYGELPVELSAMSDRFIESIKEITSASNLTPEKLSELFQEFYTTVQDKATALLRRNTLRRTYEVQMMSFEEMARKKRERKHKEAQKLLYEDLVEKKVCGACYNEIFMYAGSDDEAKDSTLATKIAALKLINVGMVHLGVPELKDSDIELQSMVTRLSPKEKLALLISAHKKITDVLSKLTKAKGMDGHSGADFVLPTLIYTVIRADPPHISSNLAFIQRFRMTKTINGETAYCLTNFEAVVAFLETVDLTTLKVDPSEITNTVPRTALAPVIPNPLESPTVSARSKSSASTTRSQSSSVKAPSVVFAKSPPPRLSDSLPKRISSLPSPVPAPAAAPASAQRRDKRFSLYPTEVAASAVSTADQGIKSLGSTFESSYKFLFGGRGNSNIVEHKPVQMRSTVNAEALERRTKEVLENSDALISSYSEGARREAAGISPPPYPGSPETEVSKMGPPLPPATLSVSQSSESRNGMFPDVAIEAPDMPIAPKSSGMARVRSNESVNSPKVNEEPESLSRSIFTNMRNFARSMLTLQNQVDSAIVAPLPKIAKPPAKFDTVDRGYQLKLGDLDDLLGDYRRLVDYLKSIQAFEE